MDEHEHLWKIDKRTSPTFIPAHLSLPTAGKKMIGVICECGITCRIPEDELTKEKQ